MLSIAVRHWLPVPSHWALYLKIPIFQALLFVMLIFSFLSKCDWILSMLASHSYKSKSNLIGKWSKMEKDTRRKKRIWEQEKKGNLRQLRIVVISENKEMA